MTELEELEELNHIYNANQESSGIEIGDTVTVIRTAKSYEEGWLLRWVPSMNKYVGKSYIVKEVISGGIGLDTKDSCQYWFPYFVLEKGNLSRSFLEV